MFLLKKLDLWFDRIVVFLLGLFVMIILSGTLLTIILRKFSISLIWIDPLVRHSVFFIAFLGGVLAFNSGQHIAIDLFGRFVEKQKMLKRTIELVLSLTTITVLGFLVRASYQLFLVEQEFGKEIFLGIHQSVLIFGIAIGFAFMMIKVVLKMFFLLSFLWGKEKKE